MDATRRQCQDPKNVMHLAHSSDAKHGWATPKSINPFSRVAIAWRLKGSGAFFHLASAAYNFAILSELFIPSDVLFGGNR